MKDVKITNLLKEDKNLREKINKNFSKYSDILKIDLEISSTGETVDQKIIDDFEGMTDFSLSFIKNVLLNNKAAIERESPPYRVNLIQKYDFKDKKFQCFVYIEDIVFGLVVGSKFKNITSLIQTFYPILAKTDYFNEIKFFPLTS